MSISNQMKKLRELLGVETNTEVLPAVQALQQPTPQAIVLAVTWTPGTPDLEATINVLSGVQVAFPALSATLRAGLAVMDYQLAQRAAQLQKQLRQMVAKDMEKEDDETKPVST